MSNIYTHESKTHMKLSIIGSNPMHEEAMKYIRSTGIAIFIDVQNEDILQRLHRMKVHVYYFYLGIQKQLILV